VRACLPACYLGGRTDTQGFLVPSDLRLAQAGGDSFPGEMDVSLPEELILYLPDGSISHGIKPVDLLQMQLRQVAPACHEQFKFAIYPIIQVVYNTHDLDS
jgi:hypothetical protein